MCIYMYIYIYIYIMIHIIYMLQSFGARGRPKQGLAAVPLETRVPQPCGLWPKSGEAESCASSWVQRRRILCELQQTTGNRSMNMFEKLI